MFCGLFYFDVRFCCRCDQFVCAVSNLLAVAVTVMGHRKQSRSFVHLVPLLPESQTRERLCQVTDISEDILFVSKYIVSLKAKFTTGLHKILHRGQ